MVSEKQYKDLRAPDEVSLKELIIKIIEWWKYLLSKWRIILVFGLLGGALGFYYATSKHPVYTATTTFVLEESESGRGGLANLAGLASMAGVDMGGGGGGIFQGDNILELYRSRTMIEKTLLTEIEYNGKKELLVDRYVDFNGLRKSWVKKPELKKLKFLASRVESQSETRLRDSVLGSIVMNINLNYLRVEKLDKKLSIIKAAVRAEDEFFAKAFNEQIVKNVNDFYVQTKTKKSIDNISILQQKTDSVRRVMNGAIYTAAAVADATPNLNLSRQVQRMAPIQRSQFNAETNKAVLGTLVQNLEMTKMALLKETPLIQVVDQPILPLKVDRFGKAKGIILGGILAGFLIVLILLVKRIFNDIMN